MNKNITLDFTSNKAMESVTSNQELAIIDAFLLKKLLKDYSKRLVRASAFDIIKEFKDSIDLNGTLSTVVDNCANFVHERHLIDNCSKENWDAFKVEVIPAPEEKPSIEKIVETSLNH